MKNEEENIEINGDNLSYLKEMENNIYFKENLDDALSEKNKLPIAYCNSQKGDDSFNEETHFSLLKELEDKWSYIEKNKPIIAKRKNCDTNDSVSLKTNSRSRLQDWKAIIEESKKKYLQQKTAKVAPTEDFSSFVKEKCEQLQMLSNKHNKANYINSNDNCKTSFTQSNIKSFLKQDPNSTDIRGSNKNNNNNPLRHSTVSDLQTNKPVKIILMDKANIGCMSLKRENTNTSNLNDKMKNVFYLITETNDSKIKANAKGKNSRVLSDVNEKDLTLNKLNRNFDAIMSRIKPNKTSKEENQFNTSFKYKPRNNSKKSNISTTISINDYQKNASIDQSAMFQYKIQRKINENTALLHELLPCTKKHKGPFFYYSISQTSKSKQNQQQRPLTLSNANLSHSINQTQQQAHLYSKNLFNTTQAKLNAVYCNKINKLMKE